MMTMTIMTMMMMTRYYAQIPVATLPLAGHFIGIDHYTYNKREESHLIGGVGESSTLRAGKASPTTIGQYFFYLNQLFIDSSSTTVIGT